MAETEIVQPQSRRRGILIVVVVVLALVAVGIWWRSTYSEDTDDAQVNGHLIQVSSRIAGQVAKVDVDENQVVKAGDTIAELDPRDYQVAVENAQAALASAQANAAAAKVSGADRHGEYGQQSSFGGRRRERHAGRRFAGGKATGSGQGARGAGPGQLAPRRRPIWSATGRWWRRT